MDNLCNEYHNKLKARMSNLIDQCAPPPVISRSIPHMMSPALDRISQTLPQYVYQHGVKDLPDAMTTPLCVLTPADVAPESSLMLTVFFWILGATLLGVLGWVIYLTVVMLQGDDTSQKKH